MDERLVHELRRHPVKFGKLIGFDKLTELHDGWIREMLDSQEDKTLLGHRSSYKTTCLSVAIALIIILQPQKNIIFIRKTDNDVTDIILQVKKILESDETRVIVQRIYGINLEIYSTMFRINTNLVVSKKGAPQLLGIGTSGSITGKHADIIFTDDIVNTRDRISKAERERVKLLYNELQNIKHRDGRIFNTGTPWHKEDAISIMPNISRYDCYRTGLISNDKLQELRASMPPSLFAANYELKHIADENALFSTPNFTDDINLVFDGIAHIDAAYGGEDSTAFTVCRKAPDGKLYMFGKKYEKHVDDCLDSILALHKALRAGTIYCERNADKGYLAKELKERSVPVKTYHESMNKYIKIASYLKKEWGNVVFVEDTDSEYIQEILDYSENAAHDDCPDSAASMVRQLENRVTLNRNIGGGL